MTTQEGEAAKEACIAGAPPELREPLHQIDALIARHLPDAAIEVKHFPVYTRDGAWCAGFAHRKQGPMFYLMDPPVVADFADRLGTKRLTGKNCIAFKPGKDLGEAALLALFDEMLTASVG